LPYGEHNFNVSTFTARVVTSTLPDIYNADTAVIGAFQRPLHSYRPGPWLMAAPGRLRRPR
jgi:citrate synthase